MKQNIHLFRISSLGMSFLLLSFLLGSIGCKNELHDLLNIPGTAKPPHLLKDFEQVNLTANNSKYGATHVDPTLLNAWGLAFSANGIPWANANGAGLSEIYDKEGAILRPPVTIPSPTSESGGTPTGIVFNNTTDFKLSNGNPARFIFDAEDGGISAWNGGNTATLMVNNSGKAVYKGLTMASNNGANYLYAADFKTGKIDVFDKDWMPVTHISFMDPNLPSGYAPFNIQNINNKLFVMYAKVGEGIDEAAGPGNGYVDIYNPDGTLIKRLVSRGQLNAPWGIAQAPDSFFDDDNTGKHPTSNVILIGNFGDGHINAYSWDGAYLGQLRAHGNPIVIEGLWALMFPPATATDVDANRLYFTAGPDDENDGLFGYLKK